MSGKAMQDDTVQRTGTVIRELSRVEESEGHAEFAASFIAVEKSI